ncbi:U3 snoRNP-associated protein Rrp9 [Schizosaccharomyces pombe]|uniref:Uncharacterized WD repeat-containing protein C2E1P5.05 n=1 Tax=Schizosaccharomyces pombe (strain 972 / ATCC 24843) TaxID=284812 RepID=YKU5_SCHPO|nr:putative U3 snoRNP-associated protein Rrp9 [Schizosaccharomyces pombe]Q9P7C0.1 RecName: Full=Uncharacterized WD repeat-containing protein C2E1P5.05 [Schizosaccharomyces pombe 972h-]CAB86348.1 U3 snoRNP-associated protein Rrp9 (predicted) [Schizosaccharomyces pombe]|eukprot:NP_594143.1 putative U3 snoRNP-associated protein Rrp9 [Schizosaccharomyces pombe]
MSDPFFTRPEHRKRKARSATSKREKENQKLERNGPANEDLASISSESEFNGFEDEIDEENEDTYETAAEKRLRLAREYLDEVKNELVEDGGFDAKEVDRELLASRLKEDVLEKKGQMYLDYTSKINPDVKIETAQLRGRHMRPLVGVVAYENFVYSADKSGLIQKWEALQEKDTENRENDDHEIGKAIKLHFRPIKFSRSRRGENDHVKEITCLAISNDGRWIVTGGLDHRIVIRDSVTLEPQHCWKHHRDAVMGLAMRRGTNEMFSCSADRSIKVWSLDQMSYIETLFGHQDVIFGVDALARERCVSVGGRDRTSRLWKIVEESQLVFRSGGTSMKATAGYMEGSVDCVAMIDEDHFVTGSDNGVIALWSVQRKKPLFTYPLAHGLDPILAPGRHSAETSPDPVTIPPQPRWITSLAAIPYSNLFASGSWDGNIRLWKIAEGLRSFEPLTIATPLSVYGCINSLSLSLQGKGKQSEVRVFAACGRETRVGRWKTLRGIPNSGFVFNIPLTVIPSVTDGDEIDE